MKLVTARTFRFHYPGRSVTDEDNEFGALIKTSFEILTGNMHSDHTGYYDDTAAYPGRVCTYSGPDNPRFVGTRVPVLRFEYFSVMIGPQASEPRPVKTPGSGGADPNLRVRWRWTVGYMPYPYYSDVVVVDTGNIDLAALNPDGHGTTVDNGIMYRWDPFSHPAMFVPPVTHHNDLVTLSAPHSLGDPPLPGGIGSGTPVVQDWDQRSSNLNLFVNVLTLGAEKEAYISDVTVGSR